MTTPPRRRWFQFSLGTLFVIVLLLSVPLGWLGVQVKWIADRHEARGRYSERLWQMNPKDPAEPAKAPWSVRLFGESAIDVIWADQLSDSECEQIQKLFPEATVEQRP